MEKCPCGYQTFSFLQCEALFFFYIFIFWFKNSTLSKLLFLQHLILPLLVITAWNKEHCAAGGITFGAISTISATCKMFGVVKKLNMEVKMKFCIIQQSLKSAGIIDIVVHNFREHSYITKRSQGEG